MWGRLHIKTTKKKKERGHKKLREQAVCELSSSQESSITVRKGNFATRY